MPQTQNISTSNQNISHQELANAIRFLSIDAVEAAKSGHPGMPMGMADIATVLFQRFLKFDPSAPNWPNRDRFILSNGHGSMLLYSLLYLTGYADMTLDNLKNFRQLGYPTAGHPEYGHASGIETTTGPLGQGLANGVGMALAEAISRSRFGADIVDHYTYVFTGDGCLQEGISQEAISFAGHLKLNKLIVLFDDNHISIDGPTDLSTSEDQLGRFTAAGWATQAIDGHDPQAIADAITKAQKSDRPTLIACRTTIGYGAPTKAGTSGSHGAPLGTEEISGTREKLDWPHSPFQIPDRILADWRSIGESGAATRQKWETAVNNSAKGKDFQSFIAKDALKELPTLIAAIKKQFVDNAPKMATRATSGEVLETLVAQLPNVIGGSADLTGSNNTRTKASTPISAADYGGSYIHYGIREHGMAAIMNGLALHGGFLPYGGTFLTFTDYCRPAIRLAALMGLPVTYVMTHDSIGLGEDGPTHQPVEHLAALRAIPNLQVFRPADGVETAECWQLALQSQKSPSLLALSRQGLPTVRTEATPDNLCAKGGYILREANGEAKVALVATGSEIEIALAAQDLLQKQNIPTRVVSMPWVEGFLQQPAAYREATLPRSCLKVAIEAALGLGWERIIGEAGLFIGMEGFGASGPAPQLYQHFGITAEAIAEKTKAQLAVLAK